MIITCPQEATLIGTIKSVYVKCQQSFVFIFDVKSVIKGRYNYATVTFDLPQDFTGFNLMRALGDELEKYYKKSDCYVSQGELNQSKRFKLEIGHVAEDVRYIRWEPAKD